MRSDRGAAFYAAISYIAWGVLPIYWKLLGEASPWEILCHRVVWSAAFLAIIVSIRKHWHLVAQVFQNKATTLRTIASSLLICGNWLLYIWAVNSGQVVESSLGYFINPLMSVALGWLLLGEKLRPLQWLAVLLALAGVTLNVVYLGVVPYLALGLAGTFALYGLLRKQSPLGVTDGLLAETAILAPCALAGMICLHADHHAVFLQKSLRYDLLFVAAGIVTSMPLLWFAIGARKLRLTTMGLLQYLSPTLQFAIGVYLYGEPVSQSKILTFALIWMGLALYTYDSQREWKLRRVTASALISQGSLPTRTSP